MSLNKAMLLFVSCGCIVVAGSAAATAPAPVLEARQGGPVSIPPASLGPGPVTPPAQSPSSHPSSTMSTSPSEPSIPLTSPGSPMPLQPAPPPLSSPPSSPSSSTSSPSGNSASPSSSSTSDAPQPSPSPSNLNFTVPNMTTCQSSNISWTYNGPAAQLLLSITNIGVSQDSKLSRLIARQGDGGGNFTQRLGDTNTFTLGWSWPSVNVTQGWYEIEGLILTTPDISVVSPPFFIANGTNVSCLNVSPTPGNTSSSGSSDSNASTIAGSVVGAIVGAALLGLLATWCWLRRRRRVFVPGARVGRQGGRWGSLKSNNSDILPQGGIGAIDRIPSRHSQTDSMGAMLHGVSGGKVSSPTTPGDSHEDVAVMGDEKLISPVSPPGMNPFEVLSTPIQYDRRTSMYSVQSPTAVADASRTRSTSVRISNQSLEQQAQRIRTSMETNMKRRSERLSMPTVPPPGMSRFSHSPSTSQAQEEYPLSPVTPTPVNRSISTGAVSTHRTPRKPVPQYDISDLREDVPTDSNSSLTTPADSAQSSGTGVGAGTSASMNGTSLSELSRKPSFADGRPMHYLIPDMPLPQDDD